MLTAIVIGLATTGFLLAMGYRSWQLNGNDEVQDDLEDRRITRRVERERLDARVDQLMPIEQDAETTHDETEGEREDNELLGSIDPILDRPREQYPTKDSWGVRR